MRENAKQEMPVEDQFYDYPDRPVPADKRRTQLNIAVVTTGMAVAMSTLYTGSALAEVMSYKDTFSNSTLSIFSSSSVKFL